MSRSGWLLWSAAALAGGLVGCTQVLGDFGVDNALETAGRDAGASGGNTGVDGHVSPPVNGDASVMPDTSTGEASVVQICTADQTQCAGSALQICNDALTAWATKLTCPTAKLCNADKGQCDEPACGPNDHRCMGAELQVCNDDQTGWTKVDTCAGPGYCSTAPAVCQTTPCTPDSQRCNGADLQTCIVGDGGVIDWKTTKTCITASLCDQANTKCIDPLCAPGQFRCVDAAGNMGGANLETCNDARNGYRPADTCKTPGLCNAAKGVCKDPTCQPGGTKCAGPQLQVCNAAQTDYSNTMLCKSASLCDGPGNKCNPPMCGNNDYRCWGDGELQKCNSELTGWDTTANCPSFPYCNPKSHGCDPVICNVGSSFRCTGAQLQNCIANPNMNQQGMWNNQQQCATAALCVNSGSTHKCNDPVCDPNDGFKCTGASLQKCNSDRTGYTTQMCSSAALCSASLGHCNNCVPNATSCAGAVAHKCSADGLTDNKTTCATPGLCNPATGTCGTVACAVGQVRCSMDLATVQTCNSDRTGWDNTKTCTPSLCNPATLDCIPIVPPFDAGL